MGFTDRLLLWLHIGFAIFTLGPAAVAVMATPRYIRRRDLAVLRYLYRTTRIFGVFALGVLVFGLLLGRHDFNQAWFTAALTLFIVAAALLVLVIRDQRRAITSIVRALAVEGVRTAPDGNRPGDGAGDDQAAEDAAGAAGGGAAGAAGAGAAPTSAVEPAGTGGDADTQPAQAAHLATVERGRIASLGGIICAIWLVILVLMVWHGSS